MSIGQNIKRLRELHGMNQSELAQIAGVTDKAVSTWENDLKIPRMGAIQKIADYFHISKSAIIEDESQNLLPIYPFPGVLPIRGHRPVPIIGNAACGQPIYKPGDGTDFIDAGPEIACDFALIADGDSMIGDRIHDGDVVFIRQQNEFEIVGVTSADETQRVCSFSSLLAASGLIVRSQRRTSGKQTASGLYLQVVFGHFGFRAGSH